MKRIFAAVVFLLGLGNVFAAIPNHSNNAPGSPMKFVVRQGPLVAQFADNSMSLGRLHVEFAGAGSQSTVSMAGNTLVYRNTCPGIETQYATYRATFKSEYHVAPGGDPGL